MENTDLITSFFNNEMSPEQERQFLVSVAASDSMRLGMKSHVMIDKMLMKQADDIYVPEPLRQSIMAQAGAGLQARPQNTGPAPAPRVRPGRGWYRAIGSVLMFCGGTALGYLIHPDANPVAGNAALVAPVQAAPRTAAAPASVTPEQARTVSADAAMPRPVAPPVQTVQRDDRPHTATGTVAMKTKVRQNTVVRTHPSGTPRQGNANATSQADANTATARQPNAAEVQVIINKHDGQKTSDPK